MRQSLDLNIRLKIGIVIKVIRILYNLRDPKNLKKSPIIIDKSRLELIYNLCLGIKY